MSESKARPPAWEVWVRACLYLFIGLSVLRALADLIVHTYQGAQVQVPTDSP